MSATQPDHARPARPRKPPAFPASSTSSRSPPARAASASPPPPAISRSALPRIGLKAGILDADIYGPSQPKLFGLRGKPRQIGPRMLEPMERFGVKVMSIGFLVEEDLAMIWRGPMVISAITQMLREVAWGDLDILVVDLPPGTGDAQLTMAQQAPLAGAVIVSTPQDIALIDARRGIAMFEKVNIPLLGLIENMSGFCCPTCNHVTPIFGHGGARLEAERRGIPFLGEIPLDIQIRADLRRRPPDRRDRARQRSCEALHRDRPRHLVGGRLGRGEPAGAAHRHRVGIGSLRLPGFSFAWNPAGNPCGLPSACRRSAPWARPNWRRRRRAPPRCFPSPARYWFFPRRAGGRGPRVVQLVILLFLSLAGGVDFGRARPRRESWTRPEGLLRRDKSFSISSERKSLLKFTGQNGPRCPKFPLPGTSGRAAIKRKTLQLPCRFPLCPFVLMVRF